jgi:hypothetical protein
MEIWLQELSEIVQLLLGKPGSLTEYVILLALVIIVLLFAMSLVGSATRIPNLGLFRRALALIAGIGFLIWVWVAVQRHALPYVETPWLRHAVSIGIPVLAGLAIVTPVQQAILRSGYTATLITFVASLALAGLFIVLAHAVLDAVRGGGEDSRSIKQRTEAVDRMLGN